MRKRFETQLALGKTPIERVVLPVRSRDYLERTRKLANDKSFGDCGEDDALALVAADLGGNSDELKEIIGQRLVVRRLHNRLFVVGL